MSFDGGSLILGSSPRVRGRFGAGVCECAGGGLIPACAGQTQRRRGHAAAFGAHPRVCGADILSFTVPHAPLGLSPRVRGRPRDGQLEWCRPGLIPACAGQTLHHLAPSDRSGAHPRVCGADRLNNLDRADIMGSSPRVRGRLGVFDAIQDELGLIPACAGQTPTSRASTPTAWAHPRVCGADRYNHNADTAVMGSSPRVRGRRDAADGAPDPAGLIPACAGQTSYPPPPRAS